MTEQPSPSLPPVAFNHLYLVLDDKTYRAIIASDYLRVAFPGVERRSTLTAAGETWSGTYYYCQNSYLEFFGASSSPWTHASGRGGHWEPGAQEGWAGLAFSTPQPGGAGLARQAMRAAFDYTPHCELRQLRTANASINWFHMLRLSERLSLGSFESWLMEYHPDIFAHKGLPLPASGELTTRAYLASWNDARVPPKPVDPAPESGEEPAVEAAASTVEVQPAAEKSAPGRPSPEEEQPAFAKEQQRSAKNRSSKKGRLEQKSLPVPTPVFSDVIGADIHMDAARAERFAEVLTLLGYAKEKAGESLLLSGGGFTLRICREDAAPSGYRLSALRLAMARPSVAPMTFVFAPRSRLVLHEDNTAEWIFGV